MIKSKSQLFVLFFLALSLANPGRTALEDKKPAQAEAEVKEGPRDEEEIKKKLLEHLPAELAGLAFDYADEGAISVGPTHSCAIKNNKLACWGSVLFVQKDGNLVTQPVAIPEEYRSEVRQVGTSSAYTCVVTLKKALACWSNFDGTKIEPLEGFTNNIRGIAVEGNRMCAWTTDSRLGCWPTPPAYNSETIAALKEKFFQETKVPEEFSTGILQASVGQEHFCATTTDHKVVCWGDNYFNQLNIPQEARSNALKVATSGNNNCVVTQDGKLVCWGRNYRNPISYDKSSKNPNLGSEVRDVFLGESNVCVINAEQRPVCWRIGYAGYGAKEVPPDLKVSQISNGSSHTCAMTTEGGVVCWGENHKKQTDVPAEYK